MPQVAPELRALTIHCTAHESCLTWGRHSRLLKCSQPGRARSLAWHAHSFDKSVSHALDGYRIDIMVVAEQSHISRKKCCSVQPSDPPANKSPMPASGSATWSASRASEDIMHVFLGCTEGQDCLHMLTLLASRPVLIKREATMLAEDAGSQVITSDK